MPSRRPDPLGSLRPPAHAGPGPGSSSARPRMYNLTAHALSSGSLLPRTADPAPTSGAVSAADAPYLTNVENHWGRVTLTAPDNMRRRQAKEKKQKARQKKAQTAHTAAAALAGVSQPVVPIPASRPASASTLNLSDTDRRDESAPASTGLLSAPTQPVIRRMHSGNMTVTLASSQTQESPRRVRRRRASRDEDRPTSRASGAPRTESSRNQFDTAPPAQPAVLPTSLHRQNIWNDITEPDPDDLPPPFPQGAPRPPTPPQPPAHSESANDQQLVGPQPHAQIPDSPPPAFRSDPESEADEITLPAVHPRRRSSASSRRRTSLPHSTSEPSSDDESVEIAQERQAWEADIRNGLSFEQRLLREQQRRIARERALLVAVAQPTTPADEEAVVVVEPVHPDVLDTAQRRRESVALAQPPAVTEDVAPTVVATEAEAQADTIAVSAVSEAPQPPIAQVVDQGPTQVLPIPAPPTPTAPTSRPVTAPSAPVRQALHNEARLGLPSIPQARAATTQLPQQPKRITHRKTNSDTRSVVQKRPVSSGRPTSQAAARPASAVPRLRIRSASGNVRTHGSETNLALNRRPEDTLFVISAPPAVAADRPTSDDDVSSPTVPAPMPAVAPIAAASRSEPSSDGEGAESDSSIEQWLAESAAFDALRRKEEEAAVRLRAIREMQVSDSDEDTDVMPGGYKVRRQAEQDALRRKWPDPALALDKARPKAPPPLVLGRSRGGAAYSDSSSESTDTDDALDQYSSSDEEHPAYQEVFASTQPSKSPQATGSTAPPTFVQSRSSTLSAPDLTGVYKQPPLPPRPQVVTANEVQVPESSSAASKNAAGVTRSLSSTARGKQPERPAPAAEPAPAPATNVRAGDFHEDETSSRDVSDAEGTAPAPQRASIDRTSVAPSFQRAAQASRASLPMLDTRTNSGGVSRSSLEPLLQPLSYGRPRTTDLGGRLKGLFGQPLISPGAADNIVAKSPPADEITQSPDAEVASIKLPQPSAKSEDQQRPRVPEPRPPAVAPREYAPSVNRQDRADQASLRSTGTAARPAPEEKAREEALSQIAKLSSASSAQRDSLAALERLLARTSRPASMGLPAVPGQRTSVQGPRQLGGEPAVTEQRSADEQERPAPAAPLPNPSRLSRQGAITRGRPANEPSSGLAPPVTYQTTGSTRPVSFVNPRSSAAPLPRGRLPAITDATRHFPPSAQSPAPVQLPAWLVHIPADDETRLPTPLEPRRLSGVPASPVKDPSSKVSQLVSRFESPAAAPPVPLRKQPSTTSLASAPQSTSRPNEVQEAGADQVVEPLRRRPPPPPPAADASPFRRSTDRSDAAPQQDVHAVGVQRISAMDALARQIDEATTSWSSPQRASFTPLIDRAPPDAPPSPRTLALENLTRGEALNGTPPRIPSKSPLMTPEQIFAGGSRTGLSASIAAAQAASLARRASRAARSGSNGSLAGESPTSPSRPSGTAGLFGPAELTYGESSRPLPTLPESAAGRGLLDSAVISASPKRLPVPPPLPNRPRDRDWESEAFGQGHASSSRAPPRTLPTTALNTASESTLPAPSALESTLQPPVSAEDGGSSAGESREPSPPNPQTRAPRREPSLGITDFDLLVAQLERDGTHFEQLSAIGEFLGPARATSATAEQMASLSVGKVECDARRITREGKVKQKLSCVGVRVDKCTICQSQFKEHQRAAILPCLHLFHEDCATQLFRRVNTCPTCRRLAFEF